MIDFKEILEQLATGQALDRPTARALLISLAGGKAPEPVIAAFLTVYVMRQITPEELSGFREAMLELCIPLETGREMTLDVCGTGGDGKETFNISTASAFVLAGAGIPVVKHGNYGVSSSCGSSNVLDYLGYRFSNDPDKAFRELDAAGITYLHAPLFHPAMKHVAPVRKALKVKTFFNILGPMVNPARPTHQVSGVFNKKVQDLYDEVFRNGTTRYCIVWSEDGYDEISLTGKVRLCTREGSREVTPEQLGFRTWAPADLNGGNSVREAAAILQSVLKGEGTPAQQEVTLANAAAGIGICYPGKSSEECVDMARQSIHSKEAFRSLKNLMDTQK